MSKVLVDRELLERILNWREGDAGDSGRDELIDILAAQPAEAEGVEVVCYLRATQDGKPEWSEDCVCEDAVYPNYEGDETFSMPMVRQSDHLAALSAVTAERDRLESMLIRTTTRHFAMQIKDRADDKKLDECLSEGIAMLEAERDRLRDQVKALQSDANSWQSGYDKGRHDGTKHRHSEVAQLRAEVEALREKAGKYATIERVMKMLECDEREGGIWTACTLLLIGSAHKMNSAKSVVDQEGVTVAAENLGNWRVTVERIDAAMAAKEA